MIPIQSGVRVWIATGYTDMRKGMHSLARQIQHGSRHDPLNGDLFEDYGDTSVNSHWDYGRVTVIPKYIWWRYDERQQGREWCSVF
jgi:hypothetical protein